jgi:hypothetical protein
MTTFAQQRLLANHANAVVGATLTASTHRPSTDLRLTAQTRQGRGALTLTGPFTGASDRALEVEILNGAGAGLRPAVPVISGVGNGALTVTAIDLGAVPETVVFRLASAGAPAVRAELPFFGVTLLARTAGTAGNALTLTVARQLTLSAPVAATTAALPSGTAELPDARWDIGATASPDGSVPLDAPRLVFDGFPTIHRQYRQWSAGRWSLQLDPALPDAIPSEVPIRTVSGDYLLTLTDGGVTETYLAVTLYEFLAALSARSALVEVVGTVVADTAPGGMAVTDLPLRTDAYALPVIAAINGVGGARRLDAVEVDPAAVSENILITNQGGGDRWSVVGGASGPLAEAVTGVPYTAAPVAFTIPAGTPSTAAGARITAKIELVPRPDAAATPAVCLRPLQRGAKAAAKNVSYRYTARPPTACDCSTLPAPRLSDVCLGLATGASATVALDPDYQSRLTSLYDWRATFFGAQSNLSPPAAATWAKDDMNLCDQVVSAFAETLALIYADATARASWDAALTQLQSEFGPLAGVGAIPATPIAVGLAPGARAQHPLTGYLYQLARVTQHLVFDGMNLSNITGGMYVGTTGLNPLNNTLYILTGVSYATFSVGAGWQAVPRSNLSAAPPLSSLTGSGTITIVTTLAYDPGGAGPTQQETSTWVAAGAPGTITNEVEALALTRLPDLTGAWSTTTGASFSLDVNLEWVADDVGDPAVNTETSTWICLGQAPDLRLGVEVTQLARRYQARMDALLPLAGLVPKSDASSGSGDGCWRDDPAATHWWVETSGVYLPAFTGVPYVSCTRNGQDLESTQEFGFAVLVACEEALIEGDQFTLILSGSNSGPYVAGDQFTLPLVGAAPAAFSRGAAANGVHQWAVAGASGGAYPEWAWDPTAPTPYTAGPLDATLTPGGIPFEVGDQISLALEGGTLRWRESGGTWTTGDLYAVGHDLGAGLTLAATPGPTPSFIAGDSWTFSALATHGPDRLRRPREGAAFAWDGAATTLSVDLGAIAELECVLLALHTLPATATIAINGGATAATDWSRVATWTAGPILTMLPAGTTARYLEIVIDGAGSGAEIGWLWAGVPWAPTAGVSALQHVRQYGLTRGTGRNPAAVYAGRGTGGRWSWALGAGGALTETDVAGLTALLDHVAAQGLEWVCLVPDLRDPSSATLAQIDADEVTFTEELGYYLPGGDKLVSCDLPFRAVLR